jgi:hypothetical protein
VRFLVDPALLLADGYVIGRISPNDGVAKALEATAITGFLATSISLYFDAEWTRPMWEACRAKSGRDWMVNSGVFRFDYEKPTAKTHALAGAIFATYPLWLRLGIRLGRHRKSKAGTA